MSTTARLPATPPGPRPGPERTERWSTRLGWGGEGPLRPPASPGRRPGEVERRVDAARLRLLGLLAAPLTDVTALDLDPTGIWAVGYALPVT